MPRISGLSTRTISNGTKNITAYYRPDTTDEKVLKEVVDNRAYRRASVGFDVKAGEHWLDLGANIGAFAIYCRLNGATAYCFEPEPKCFNILKLNAPRFSLTNAAVTSSKEKTLKLWTSSMAGNHYRGTTDPKGMRANSSPIEVPNFDVTKLKRMRYDGIKMDIEGGEFEILDQGLLPECTKFCFEYHTSRDKSMTNLKRRLQYLKSKFSVVSYTPELDQLIKLGGQQRSFHDRVIYCIK